MKTDKELAYRYDLYLIPYWREPLDQMVLEHVEIPPQGTILTVNCGTGGLALELASSLGSRGEVVATDEHAERLALARAKATAQKLTNVFFFERMSSDLGMEGEEFKLVIADAALMRPAHVEDMLVELVRLTELDATLALMLLTHGSFGEIYSLLWEALFVCQLEGYTPHIETLINEYPTTSQAQEMMKRCGLRHVHHFTERRELDFASAQELFESPLVEDYFLDHWLEFLPDAMTRHQVLAQMSDIIDAERREEYVELSVKATLLVGKKQ